MKAKTEMISLRDLLDGPIRDKGLTGEQKQRIAALHATLREVPPAEPIENWTLNFMRDADPEKEIAIWEWMAEQYRARFGPTLKTAKQRSKLFGEILQESFTRAPIVVERRRAAQ
jgi:hypothetical protein